MKIYRTSVGKDETLNAAIIRAGVAANRLGFDGYEIVCGQCGQPIVEHEFPTDCAVWNRELGRTV